MDTEINSAILKFPSLSDNDFVDFVREKEKENPSWINYSFWANSVNRELQFRAIKNNWNGNVSFVNADGYTSIIVSISSYLTSENQENIGCNFEKAFPGKKIILVVNDMKLDFVKE